MILGLKFQVVSAFLAKLYLYLSALADSESEGADIEQLLEKISSHKIPFIKKEEREPTFEAILNICKKG